MNPSFSKLEHLWTSTSACVLVCVSLPGHHHEDAGDGHEDVGDGHHGLVSGDGHGHGRGRVGDHGDGEQEGEEGLGCGLQACRRSVRRTKFTLAKTAAAWRSV